MTRVRDLHARWMKDPSYAEAYEALAGEFLLAAEIIAARKRAKLTQAELAKRMDTTQTVVARLESGAVMPTTRTLARVAAATGTHVHIRLLPAPKGGGPAVSGRVRVASTSKTITTSTAKVLTEKAASKVAKSAAGSALTQRRGSTKPKKPAAVHHMKKR